MSGGKWFFGLMAIFSVTISSGCATVMPAQVARDAKAGFYDTASITYKIDAGRNGVPLSVVRIDGRLVSYDEVPVRAVADRCVGTLSIEYPHPRGRKGYALARVVIDSRDGSPVVGGDLVAGGRAWTERLSSAAAPWNWFASTQSAQDSSPLSCTMSRPQASAIELISSSGWSSNTPTVSGRLRVNMRSNASAPC